MREIVILTANEIRLVELGREIKKRGAGHGRLVVEYRDRTEVLFEPTPRELPPDHQSKTRC